MTQEEPGAGRAVDGGERADEAAREPPAGRDSLSPEELQRVLHDLRVHQIEVEMQNEELRRMRQELELSRDRHSDLYELAPVGYVTMDEGGIVLEANLTSADLLGVEKSRLIGGPLSRYVARDDQSAFFLHRRSAFQSREQQMCEIRMGRADDTTFLAQITSIFVRDSEHNRVCRTAIIDVSERARREEQLRFQAQLLESVRESVVATDLEGHVLYWGKGAEALYGYRSDEVMGKVVTFVVEPQDEQKELERMRQVLETGSWSGRYLQQRRDGTVFWADTVISLVTDPDGEPRGLIGLDRDITAWMEASEALRVERDRAQRYLNIAAVIIIALNTRGEVTLINTRGCQILEADKASLLGKNWFDHFVPESIRDEVKAAFQALMAGEIESVEYFENPILTSRGAERMIAWNNSLLTDDAGSIVGTLSSGRDITEQLQREQEIARLARFPSENPNPVLRMREDGTILYGNQASAVLLNAWGRQVGQGLPDAWQREVKSALDSNLPVTIETDAGERTFMLTLAPLVEQGYVNAYGLDITKRKQAEEALRQALETSQQRQKEVSALLVASRVILNQRNFADTARSLFDACKDLLGAAAGYVALMNKGGTENEVLFLDAGGRPCAVDPSLTMPVRGLRAEAYRTGMAVYDNGFAQSEWAQYMPGGHVSLDNVLFAPLVIEGKPAGLLGLANKPGGFTQDDARIASAFGELAAVALHNSRTLASLANSEQRFRAVAETANDAILSADESSRIILWNRAAQLMFGYSAEQVLGKPVATLMPERFRAGHQGGIRRFLKTRQPSIIGQTVEMAGLRKDGTEFPLAISLATWKAGGATFFTALLRDITDRKQAEETLQRYADELEARVAERTAELAQANQRLQREIAERAQAEENLLRLNQELETLNEVAITLSQSSDLRRVLDATLDQVLATMEIDAGMIHLLEGDGQALALAAHRGLSQDVVPATETALPGASLMRRAIQSGQPVTSTRVVVPASRGEENAADTTIHAFASVPLRVQDTVLGVLSTYSHRPREFSPREVQLLTAIGHQVGVAVENARLTSEAAEMEVLQELDRLRSELIANVSHELRTPLGLIKAFCSSLMMEDVELPMEARLDFLQGIDEEADKLETIVTNLLSLSRMESGRLYLNRYPTDLGQLVREIVARMDAQAPQHRLICDVPHEPLVAAVDARSIEQVVRNLVDNAIKYSPAGGVITVHCHRDETLVWVAVNDEGIGIQPKDLERVFERFYRVDSEVGRSAGGVGLGLAVCRSIVEAHGGRIWVESALGEGSTFRFTMPVAAPDKGGERSAA